MFLKLRLTVVHLGRLFTLKRKAYCDRGELAVKCALRKMLQEPHQKGHVAGARAGFRHCGSVFAGLPKVAVFGTCAPRYRGQSQFRGREFFRKMETGSRGMCLLLGKVREMSSMEKIVRRRRRGESIQFILIFQSGDGCWKWLLLGSFNDFIS